MLVCSQPRKEQEEMKKKEHIRREDGLTQSLRFRDTEEEAIDQGNAAGEDDQHHEAAGRQTWSLRLLTPRRVGSSLKMLRS